MIRLFRRRTTSEKCSLTRHRIEVVEAGVTRHWGGMEYRATCSCGWFGVAYLDPQMANFDALDHADATAVAPDSPESGICPDCGQGYWSSEARINRKFPGGYRRDFCACGNSLSAAPLNQKQES